MSIEDTVKAIEARLSEYYSDEEIGRWMCEPHPQLAGETALSVAEAGHPERVHAIIDRLDSGAYL